MSRKNGGREVPKQYPCCPSLPGERRDPLIKEGKWAGNRLAAVRRKRMDLFSPCCEEKGAGGERKE